MWIHRFNTSLCSDWLTTLKHGLPTLTNPKLQSRRMEPSSNALNTSIVFRSRVVKMSFRILTHAKDYFNNWPSKEGTLWDQYYVCFILGIVGNKRGEVNQSNSDEIVRYIIQPYIKSKSAFLGLLTYAHLRQLGHKIDDRKLETLFQFPAGWIPIALPCIFTPYENPLPLWLLSRLAKQFRLHFSRNRSVHLPK